MRVQAVGREDPQEEEMAIHSNILAWKISWTEEPGGLQSLVLLRWKKAITCNEETIYQVRHAGWGTDSPGTIYCLESCLHLFSDGRRSAPKHIHMSNSVSHTHTHTQFFICSDFYQYFMILFCLVFLQTVLPH